VNGLEYAGQSAGIDSDGLVQFEAERRQPGMRAHIDHAKSIDRAQHTLDRRAGAQAKGVWQEIESERVGASTSGDRDRPCELSWSEEDSQERSVVELLVQAEPNGEIAPRGVLGHADLAARWVG
jgi:hypothetical protein